MVDNAGRIPSHPVIPPQVPQVAPRRAMLMTPQMIVGGGMLAFLTVLLSVVMLPVTTYQPPVSSNWLPLSDAAYRGRAVFLANGCVYCHSGFSRPQDVYEGLYYLYPRASEPGDFRGLSQSPNILGSARTGPDLSQEGGNHPDTWHVAHYQNPRNTTPISIMPSFSFLSDTQVADLIAFDQSAGGKEATLRYAAILVGNSLMRLNMGMQPDVGGAITDLIDSLKDPGDYQQNGQPEDKSPSGLPWKAVWMLNSFERGYWLTEDPLEVTQQNLIRGKAIFLERCSGCHGVNGDGNGTAASFFMIPPFDFTQGSVATAPGTSSGMFYHRILTAGPGTAMENFGTRLSVQDIWRVVLFLRTIHKGGLKAPIPTPDMYEPWQPPPPLLNYITAHPIEAQVESGASKEDGPFMDAAHWVAPGLVATDEILIGGKLPMTVRRLADLIRSTYFGLIDTAYQDTTARGETLPALNNIHSTEGMQFHAP